jgi:hypothetical protein
MFYFIEYRDYGHMGCTATQLGETFWLPHQVGGPTTMKMEAAGSSETLIPMYKTTCITS